jgi:hypothetical protein
MPRSPTPEQSARAILGVFKSQNCIAGDPLKTTAIKTQFLENHGSAADFTAGMRKITAGSKSRPGTWALRARRLICRATCIRPTRSHSRLSASQNYKALWQSASRGAPRSQRVFI